MKTSTRFIAALAISASIAACSHVNRNGTTTAQSAAPANVVASDGAAVYETNCSSCHQASGQGVPETFPPLNGNPVVTGDPARVIQIIKDGLTGTIVVKGASYSGVMPAWGQTLSSADIAAVITYVRSSWGNSASAVTLAKVAATR